MGRLVMVAVAVRVVAALVLAFGPWTDSRSELAGWDVDRFQQLAEEPGRHWVDHAVEYPPGSVAIIELVAGNDVVDTHRRLVILSLAVDLSLAVALGRLGGPRSAAAYLLAGLPLVPMGLLRFDLWAAAAAVGAVAALRSRRSGAFGLLVVAGAMIKIWPAVLVAGAVATGRLRAAAAAVVAGAVAGVAWLAYGGWRLDPVDQVLSLRGATGWHVESVPGSIVALAGGSEPVLQLNAFRIGQLDARLVLAGRVLTVAIIVALVTLVVLVARRRAGDGNGDGDGDGDGAEPTVAGERWSDDPIGLLALVMLGSTAALVVTAPLLSPQFLLWLTPWVALLAAGDEPLVGDRRRLLTLVVVATAVTGLVLGVYGPPEVHNRVPAAALLVRDAALVGVVVLALRAAATIGTGSAPGRVAARAGEQRT